MNSMEKWARIKYMPIRPLGDNRSQITGCKKHIALSKQAADEGMVLLKNRFDVLPIPANARVAIFGKAQIEYAMGGGGSGSIYSEYRNNIYSALKESGKVKVFEELSMYYQCYVENAYQKGEISGFYDAADISDELRRSIICSERRGLIDEAEIPENLLEKACDYTDTAIIVISRYSGEGWDRKNDGTDTYFDLSPSEKTMVDTVIERFSKIIVLINSGAMIDSSWYADNDRIQAALMIWQGGVEGAKSAADALTGIINPSGKLVDTCAISFSDYPSSEGFHESDDYVKYTEDIFVGYRYFETVPGKKDRVIYPFGYGLSYTSFEFSDISAVETGGRIYVSVVVKNTGGCSGKEVIQLYYNAPRGRITKPSIELCAFKKTKELSPGECQTVFLDFAVTDMASYDDTGIVCENSYVMEPGEYRIYLGNSVRNVTEVKYRHIEKDLRVIEKLTQYCAPEKLDKRLDENGEYIEVAQQKQKRRSFQCSYVCERNIPDSDNEIKKLIDVYNGELTIDEFLTQLTDEELMSLLKATASKGVTNTGGLCELIKYGIYAPMTADGPAGVRIFPYKGVTATGFPIATMLACTWNTELIELIGKAGALEMKENNLFVWLAPALNIHRSPLCGRNFEYYSEDPYVAGKMAAAMVRGIQSEGIVSRQLQVQERCFTHEYSDSNRNI